MRTRAALQTALEQRLIIDEIEIPDPQSNQVIVKLASSGVCHSQLHGMHDPQQPRPMVLGHEGAGTVNRVGPGITNVKEGGYGQPILCEISREAMAGRIKPETSAVVSAAAWLV